jgi:pilus assembly protein CpaE
MAQTPSNKITLLIVDDIPETRENLRKLLYFEPDIEIVGTAASGREAIEQAKALQPNIVLMDINMPDMDGIAASQEISHAAPMCQVIMMSVQSEADYLRRSMLAGAMDFLTKPFTSEELSSSIHRVHDMAASRRVALPAMPDVEEGQPLGRAAAGRRPERGKLLLLYSPKGGTGCTTVAANLAIALKETTGKEVVLVDASLQFGDLDVHLNIQDNRTIANATSRINELDTDLLESILSHHPSGLRVLAAPPAPEMAEKIEPEDIKAILKLLRRTYDYVLVDTWSYLDDIVLSVMDVADRILLVMTPEIPSIKSAKQFFEVAEALQFPLDQIDLILNKIIPRDGIRPDQLEGSIKHKVQATLEYDPKSVRQAVNQGVPLVMIEPNHPLSQHFLALAQEEIAFLEPQPEETPSEESAAPKEERRRRSGLFGRLKK